MILVPHDLTRRIPLGTKCPCGAVATVTLHGVPFCARHALEQMGQEANQ